MTTPFLIWGLALLAAGQTPPTNPPVSPLKIDENAPRLLNRTEREMDQIIDRFIDYDLGRLQGPEAQRALLEFNRLDVRAIPALARGLNRAANERGSCPIIVLANRLRTLLSFTEDPRVIDDVLRTLGAGVVQSPHLGTLQGLREELLARKILIEQGQLASVRVRDVLVRQLSNQNAAVLKEALKDPRSNVRFAAARVIGSKDLPYGDELIDLLSDDNPDVRQTAQQALIRLSRGLDLGPDRKADDSARSEAVAQWRLWWEAARLGYELRTAPPPKQDDVLLQLRDTKGAYYTQALADAIPQLTGSLRAKARDALAERLQRMTANTLHDKLQDENAEIRRAAALACALKGEKVHVPDLIALLEDPEVPVARAAHTALKNLSGQDLGPAANATSTERAEAVRQWRAWWEKQGKR